MSQTTTDTAAADARGLMLLRAALVFIFLLFSMAKFTPYAAEGIQPLLTHSPLLAWTTTFGVSGSSRFVGVFELLTAVLLIVGFRSPASIWARCGAAMSTIVFLGNCILDVASGEA